MTGYIISVFSNTSTACTLNAMYRKNINYTDYTGLRVSTLETSFSSFSKRIEWYYEESSGYTFENISTSGLTLAMFQCNSNQSYYSNANWLCIGV